MTEPVVQVTDLVKRYGELEAVRGINFEVQPGETFGFLGPNGAGKSTTIKILCTLANPTSGSARVAGYDVLRQRDTVRRNIGLVFQDPTLDSYLTGEQNLRFHADLYGVPRSQLAARMKLVLDMVNLWDRRDSVVCTYSGGMKRRLEIARGLLHAPRVLFLDEPTVGLDPQTRSSIWEYVNDLKQREDITIFLTTHYMDEAEHCDRIAIIDHGQIVAIDTPENLKASVGKDRVQISTADDAGAIKELKDRFDLDAAVHEGLVTFSVASGEQFVPRLFAELTQPIRSVSVATAVPGRRLHVLHRPDDQGLGGDRERQEPRARDGLPEREVTSAHGGPHHHAAGPGHRPGRRLGHRGHPGRHPGKRPAAGPAGGQHRLAPGADQVQERPAARGHHRWSSRCFSCSSSAPACPRSPATACRRASTSRHSSIRACWRCPCCSRPFSRPPRLSGTGSSASCARCWWRRSAGRRSSSGNALAARPFRPSRESSFCALAGLAGVPYNPILILTVIGELLLLSFTLTAFGVMMAARIKQIQAFMALTQMLVMPLFFLSGALYPLRSLPAWLTVLTRFDPLTYVVYPMRHAVFSHLSISPAASAVPVPGRHLGRLGGSRRPVAWHRRGDGRRTARAGDRGVPAYRVSQRH